MWISRLNASVVTHTILTKRLTWKNCGHEDVEDSILESEKVVAEHEEGERGKERDRDVVEEACELVVRHSPVGSQGSGRDNAQLRHERCGVFPDGGLVDVVLLAERLPVDLLDLSLDLSGFF